jgi:hypothetical protein
MVGEVYRRWTRASAGDRPGLAWPPGQDGGMCRLPPSGRLPMSAAMVLAAAMALGVVGCRGSSSRAAAPANGCAPAFKEQLDSRSTQHLFPGAPQPSYLTDPPTSGPHQLGDPSTGAATTPIPRPRQVAMLEIGYIVVQYQGLPAPDIARLGTLAGQLVTVAPAAGPLPAPIVATAWTWKQQCRTADAGTLAGLQAFIVDHRGKGFSHG